MRDGILAERQSFYLDNQAEREPAEVAEEFIGQYYSASPAVPRTIVVGPYLAERAELLADGAERAARLPGRGAGRRARRQAPPARAGRAQRPPRPRPGPAAARAPAPAPGRLAGRPARGAGRWRSCRCGSRASTSPTSAASTPSPRWSSSRAARPRRPTTAASRCAASASNGSDDFASMEEVLGRRVNRYLEQVDLSPHDGKRDESFASLPSLVVVDGGKGQLARGDARPAALRRARRHRRLPRQARGGGLRPRPAGADRPGRRLGGLEAAAAGPRRGAPLRDRPPPRPPRPGDDRLGPRRAARASARSASVPCSSTSAPRSGSWRRPARSWRRCPACPASWRARSTSSCTGSASDGEGKSRRGERRRRQERGPGRDHRPLRGRQVGGDRRLRGRRLLLRRQPAAADDRQPRRAVPPRGQRRRARRGRLRRARRRLLRRPGPGARRPRGRRAAGRSSSSSRPTRRRCSTATRRRAAATRSPRRAGSSRASGPSASCWRRCASAPTSSWTAAD